MEGKLSTKESLYKICEEHLEEKIKIIESNLKSIADARNNETKSSVGDKYETGRAMMQFEEQKLQEQLSQVLKTRNLLHAIDPNRESIKVERGSIVETEKANYFISIGVGEVELGGTIYYCVSANSPIGKVMLGKKSGETFNFNGNQSKIDSII